MLRPTHLRHFSHTLIPNTRQTILRPLTYIPSSTSPIRPFHTSPKHNTGEGPHPSRATPIYPEDPHPTHTNTAQKIATGSIPRFAMSEIGNRKDAPPKHEMVYFRGLLNTERRFGDFRTVLHTGLYSQVVAMEVPVNGEIGDEVHTVDQILLFTAGKGLATVAGKDQEVQAGDVVVVPAGTQHQFVTVGDKPLELITVYSPAEHAPNTVHKTKEEGDKAEEEGIDEAPAWSHKSKKDNEDAGLARLDATYANE